MRFFNEFDIESARRRFDNGDYPNLAAAVETIDNVRRWTDCNSDGWAYWSPPVRACGRLIELVENAGYCRGGSGPSVDCSPAELAAAVRPVKSFRTKVSNGTNPRWGLPAGRADFGIINPGGKVS